MYRPEIDPSGRSGMWPEDGLDALCIAVKLGIPDLVAAGPNTDVALARATGAKEEGFHRLVRLLVAMEIFPATEPPVIGTRPSAGP